MDSINILNIVRSATEEKKKALFKKKVSVKVANFF